MANIFSKAASWADRQLFGSGPQDAHADETAAARSRIGTQGAGASDEYYRRATSFDPMAAIRETAGGLYDQFEQSTGRKIADLRGNLVGSGRLDSGYGAQDEDSTIFDARRDLNSQIAGLSMQGANLTLRNNEDLGRFGESQTGTYLDLLTGQQDRDMAAWNARNSQRSSFWGGVSSLAGKLIGAKMGGGGGGG